MFGFGEDDEAFFLWRKESFVTIGNDVWIGHAASVMRECQWATVR
jgi:acetyltransferase-like isoleucine patch superfamily enzyme